MRGAGDGIDACCSAAVDAPNGGVPRLGEWRVALERCDHWTRPPLPKSEGLNMEMEWRERLLGSLRSWNASKYSADASRACAAIKAAADEPSGDAAHASAVEYLGGGVMLGTG